MNQKASAIETLMLKAWDRKLLDQVGKKQKDLLVELAARKSDWTEEGLRNLLLMVKHDFPEDFVSLSRSWDQPARGTHP